MSSKKEKEAEGRNDVNLLPLRETTTRAYTGKKPTKKQFKAMEDEMDNFAKRARERAGITRRKK
jgi:hypothetical protein